jgi:hypothetical protein
MVAKRGRERVPLYFSRYGILDLYRNNIYSMHIPYNRDTKNPKTVLEFRVKTWKFICGHHRLILGQ